jgi:hypothetical protein
MDLIQRVRTVSALRLTATGAAPLAAAVLVPRLGVVVFGRMEHSGKKLEPKAMGMEVL